jgi:hypothetical protein
MRSIGSLAACVAAAIACAPLAAAGCGGGDSADAEGPTGLQTEPARLIGTVMRVASEAKNKRDCKEVDAINKRSQLQIVCPPESKQQRATNRAAKMTRAAVYGDAAVVEYTAPDAKGGASIVLYRDPSRRWTVAQWGLAYPGAVGTENENGDDTREAVDRYLAAVKDRDCKAFNRYAATYSRTLKEICKTEFAVTEQVAKVLKADPNVEVEYVGGNEAFAFYRLTADRPQPIAYTISTAKTPERSSWPHLVLDLAPAPLDSGS